MRTMTGGQAVVEALAASGVEVVFGIIGVHTMHIYDALYDHPVIRQVTARHEQGAAFMADGYARASGRVGVLVLITGPGGTNAATGVAQAYADSSPVLVIQSNVASHFLDRQVGTVHEMKDQRAFFESITRYSQRILRVEDIPEAITTAIEALQTGRPRPVHIDIPTDLLAARSAFASPLRPPRKPVRQMADPQDVDTAANLLRQAKRPVMYAGGGIQSADASAELIRLAELLQAPVVTTAQGRGAIPDDHPLGLGNAWGRHAFHGELARETDLVLAAGAQLSELNVGNGRWPSSAHLVHIDVDASVFDRFYPASVALQGDARAILTQLLEALKDYHAPNRNAYLARVTGWHERQVAHLRRTAPVPMQFLQTLRQTLSRDAIVVNDMTMPSYWAQKYLPAYQPRTFLSPNYFATLGFSLPAAIGAKLAQPERQVISICGDGGFLFTCQELATAAQLGLDLPVVVFNDHRFSTVKSIQDRTLNGRSIGIDLYNPDFVKFGEAFGIRSRRVEHVAELDGALTDAFDTGGPWLIEAPVSLSPSGFP